MKGVLIDYEDVIAFVDSVIVLKAALEEDVKKGQKISIATVRALIELDKCSVAMRPLFDMVEEADKNKFKN